MSAETDIRARMVMLKDLTGDTLTVRTTNDHDFSLTAHTKDNAHCVVILLGSEQSEDLRHYFAQDPMVIAMVLASHRSVPHG